MLGAVGADGRRPSEDTIRRAFTAMDGDRLDGLIGAWMLTRVWMLAGRHVIAIDGAKRLPGTPPRTWSRPWTTPPGSSWDRLQVALKSNDEIPALRTLHDAFDLARSGK